MKVSYVSEEGRALGSEELDSPPRVGEGVDIDMVHYEVVAVKWRSTAGGGRKEASAAVLVRGAADPLMGL